jgi:abortive infection bacteriophage resistance protein
MQNIVNFRDIIKTLTKNGLVVGDKQLFYYYIKNFNFNTFIHEYSEPFLVDQIKKKFDPEAHAEELIELYRFDRDMGNHILRYILVIEKMINTNVAYEIINSYNIRDKCLFKFDQRFIENNVMNNIKDIEPRINYYNFVRKLVKYLPSSKITKKYAIKNCNDEIYR